MKQEPETQTKAESYSLRSVVTDLFDAVRSSARIDDLKAKESQLEKGIEGDLSKIDDFMRDISGAVRRLEEEVRPDHSKELAFQVSDFGKTAVEQAKERIRDQSKKEAGDLDEAISSETIKVLKGLESFFSSRPLPVIDKVIFLKLVGGGYEARTSYTCQGGIDYEFSLGAQNSSLFKGEFKFSQLRKQLKVPVRLGKTWIKKERTPDFERLDRYILTNAEGSDRNLLAGFQYPDGTSRINCAYTDSTSHGFTSVEFIDGDLSVNVTGDSALSQHLDSNALKEAMELLWNGLRELEKSKVAMTKLQAGGEDVLDDLNCVDLMKRVFAEMGSQYRSTVRKLLEKEEVGDSELSLAFIRERIKLLGTYSRLAEQALGLKP